MVKEITFCSYSKKIIVNILVEEQVYDANYLFPTVFYCCLVEQGMTEMSSLLRYFKVLHAGKNSNQVRFISMTTFD